MKTKAFPPKFNSFTEILQVFTREDPDRAVLIYEEDGAPFCQVTVYKHFKDAAAKAEIPETRVHDLRHQYATKLLEGGVDLHTGIVPCRTLRVLETYTPHILDMCIGRFHYVTFQG